MVDKTKHTPGPWEWGADSWLYGPVGVYVLQYAGCGSHECEVSDANARLIAAAPDLLEALERLVHWCGERDVLRDEAERARAAIAKAKGE